MGYLIGLFFLFFCYLVNLEIVYPPYYMLLPIALLGVGVLVSNVNSTGKIDKKFLIQLFILVGYLFFWSISSIVNGIFNYDYLKEIFITSILFLFSALFIHYCIKSKDSSFVITFIGQVVFFQLILSFIAYLNPSVFNYIFSIVQIDNLESDRLESLNNARMVGIGKSFFGLGVLNCITLILLAFQINKKTKYIVWDLIAYIGIAIIGFLGSRSTVVGFLLSLILFYKNPKMIVKAILGFIFLIITLYPLFNFLTQNEKFIVLKDFGFDLLFNTDDSQAVQSVDTLKSMFSIYPDNLKTWLFGDIFYRDEYGGYYKNTDIGYMRIIFSGGVIGLIYYFFVMFFLLIKSNYVMQSKVLLVLLVLLVLFLNLKGVANVYYYLILLTFLNAERSSK